MKAFKWFLLTIGFGCISFMAMNRSTAAIRGSGAELYYGIASAWFALFTLVTGIAFVFAFVGEHDDTTS